MAGDSWWSKPFRDKAWDATRAGGRGLRTIVEKPYRVGSGEGLFSGRPAEWLGIFLKWFFGIVIILAFVLFLVFLYRSYSTGFGGTVTEEGLVAIDETGSPVVARTGILDYWDFLWNPSSSNLGNKFVWESEVVENEYNEDLGVKITDFKETSSYYFSYDPIQLVGEVEAFSLEDSILKYSCELEDYEGVVKVDPEEYPIHRQTGKEITSVSCYFDNGFGTEKDEESRIAKLKVAYDFTTKASLGVYFLNKEALDVFRNRGEDPLEKVRDPHLMSDGTTEGVSTDGPIRVDFKIAQRQPLVEEENRHLTIELVRRPTWSGELKEVKNFELKLPFVMDLTVDPNYCDFESTGEVDETGLFNIYRLTESSFKNKVNIACSQNFLANLGYSMTEDECRERYKNKISLGCDFRVSNIQATGDRFKDFVNVRVDYIYETENKEVVTVFKREGLGIDTCKDLSKDACLSTNRCKPLYGITRDDYLGCEACPETWRYCTNYDGSRILCEDDPCEVGPCKFEDNSCKSASSV